jgi:hypothetical protein
MLFRWSICRTIYIFLSSSTARATPSKTVCLAAAVTTSLVSNTVLGALQFLGNLFEYLLVRKNKGKEGKGGFSVSLWK